MTVMGTKTDKGKLLYDLLTSTFVTQWAALESLTGQIRCHVQLVLNAYEYKYFIAHNSTKY